MTNHLRILRSTVLLAGLLWSLFAGQARAAAVLFDQGHGQVFVAEGNEPLDLSQLAAVFKKQGLEVKIGKGPLTANALTGVTALIVSGPFKPLSQAEIDAVLQFIGQGGTLCLMLHIAPPNLTLLSSLGVAHSEAPLNEQENIIGRNPKSFSVVNLAPHPLTRGLTSFNAYGAWGVMPQADTVRIVAATSPRAWLDTNGNGSRDREEVGQAHGVVVAGTLGKGRFVVFGDDAIFQNQFLADGNLRLAQNLAAWLQGAN